MKGAILAVSGQSSRLVICPSHSDQRRHGSEIGNNDRRDPASADRLTWADPSGTSQGSARGGGELAARKSALAGARTGVARSKRARRPAMRSSAWPGGHWPGRGRDGPRPAPRGHGAARHVPEGSARSASAAGRLDRPRAPAGPVVQLGHDLAVTDWAILVFSAASQRWAGLPGAGA